ncbi:unnamed protein product [Chrysoparadoxa australica]
MEDPLLSSSPGAVAQRGDPKATHQGQLCGTAEGVRVWCIKTSVAGIILVTLVWLALGGGVCLAAWVSWTAQGLPPHQQWVHTALYTLLSAMALWSHARTAFSDPGAVPKGAQPILDTDAVEEMKQPRCSACDAFKPPRAHHCRVCCRCIVRMDHHCPWMNNCIGLRTLKPFLLFLIYCCATSLYALTLMVYYHLACKSCRFTSTGKALSATLAAGGLAGFLFCVAMLISQMHAIAAGMGTIDRMQAARRRQRLARAHHRRRTSRRQQHFLPLPWADIMGRGSKLLWLVPTLADLLPPEACGYVLPKPLQGPGSLS